MKTNFKIISYFFLFLLLFASVVKAKNKPSDNALPGIKIAIISDVHVMDSSLLIKEGAAFENYVAHDRKMLKESRAILQELTRKLIAAKPEIVLLTGDLTKDGEEISHRYLVDNCLSKMKAAGIKVLVIPGNHDVNNPHAVSFNGSETKRVKTVSPTEFAHCYANYGYGDAIAKDEHSLSYVSQPSGNLRILAIDACRYEENDYSKNTCVTGGRIKPETMLFIKDQIADAKAKGIQLFAMMHHGLVQHWNMQEKLMPEYLVDNWQNEADTLAELGLKIVFTGHFHAQDIVKHNFGNHFIYDIETGSTVTYPSPYRLISLKNNQLTVRSFHIENIDYDLGGLSFTEYARKNVLGGIASSIIGMLPASLPESDKKTFGEILSRAIIAHYHGDEQLSEEEKVDLDAVIKKLKTVSPQYASMLKAAAYGLWTDLSPADNNITIDLNQK